LPGEEEGHYPVRTLHEFLSELEGEWRKFWLTSLLGLVTSILLLSLVVLYALQILGPEQRYAVRTVVTTIGSAGLIYSAYAVMGQRKFFKRWGRRFSKLRQLEEKMLPSDR